MLQSEAKLSPPYHGPFLISPIWCMSPDLSPVFNRTQVPLAEPPSLATKGLPLPWEQVPFKSSLASFLCSWLSSRIFHDAIPYGVTGKELLSQQLCLEQTHCSASTEPFNAADSCMALLLCPPSPTGGRDIQIQEAWTPGTAQRARGDKTQPPPLAITLAVAGDWAQIHQMHLTFPREVHRLLLQGRRVILEWKVRSCSFYPFGGAVSKENNAGFSGIRSISCIIF